MKKTATLKHAESIKLRKEFEESFSEEGKSPDLEPREDIIRNILNYSRSLSVKHSVNIGHILILNN